MQLSVVSTLFQSAPYIDEFYRRIRTEAEQITSDLEFVFVNDGSTDRSLEVALELQAQDRRVRIVDLSRNFGHHKAIMTGLEQAHGDLVFLIDVDLEEPPEILGAFFESLNKEKADAVYGVQSPRHGPWLTRTLANLFYWVLELLSDYRIPPHSLTARLMTRRYVDQLVKYKEHLSNMIGLWELTGFKQVAVGVRKSPFKGTTTYTFRRRLAAAIYAITAFSSKPLRLIAYLGLLVTALSTIYAIVLVVQYFVFAESPTGWTSLIVSISLFSGLILFCQGIIAAYLAVIFIETKNRPYTVIRKIYEARSP
jgi:putative glycosyltransferase